MSDMLNPIHLEKAPVIDNVKKQKYLKNGKNLPNGLFLRYTKTLLKSLEIFVLLENVTK